MVLGICLRGREQLSALSHLGNGFGQNKCTIRKRIRVADNGRLLMPLRMSGNDNVHSGFTIIEALAVVVIIAILAAIAAPVWVKFAINREVKAARDQLHQGIRQAQTQAIARRVAWQFSVRESSQVEWAIHPHTEPLSTVSNWQQLSPKIVVDWDNTSSSDQDQVYAITFDFKGNVETRSIITVEARSGIAKKQCVLINNLLGRTSQGQELPALNRFGLECF